MNRRVVISGCSGGGKSTLLKELSDQGFEVVEEPGRRVIANERLTGGSAFPWNDVEGFLRRALDMSRRDIASHAHPGNWVFFDRGLIDAASGLASVTGEPISAYLENLPSYSPRVFLAPPWAEIYVTDADRQHSLSEALVEYERLSAVYPAIGYEVLILPKASVEARADFVLEKLGE